MTRYLRFGVHISSVVVVDFVGSFHGTAQSEQFAV